MKVEIEERIPNVLGQCYWVWWRSGLESGVQVFGEIGKFTNKATFDFEEECMKWINDKAASCSDFKVELVIRGQSVKLKPVEVIKAYRIDET